MSVQDLPKREPRPGEECPVCAGFFRRTNVILAKAPGGALCDYGHRFDREAS